MGKINSIAAILLLSLVIVSCGGKKEKKPVSVEGSWELASYATKAVNFGSESVSVYLVFGSADFTVYQKLGAGSYRKYTGTYSILDDQLTGTYSDGKPLSAIYDIENDGSTLVLSTDKEAYTYKSAQVPGEVIGAAY